jgi:hypothetical protein
MWESHPAVDPLTGDLWFVRSDAHFSGWKLFVARCRGDRWSTAIPMPLAGNGLEADPWFAADGSSLWFISTGAGAASSSGELDIWRMERANGRWGEPERLPSPLSSPFAEWFPRLAADGWLYFGSRRPGGFGKDDIWRARETARGVWMVENAGPGLNTPDEEYEFEPAPDGKWGILSTGAGLIRVVHAAAGWKRAGRFGQTINSNGSEIGPLIDSSGRGFLFSRDAGGGASGELFAAGVEAIGRISEKCAPPRTNARDP